MSNGNLCGQLNSMLGSSSVGGGEGRCKLLFKGLNILLRFVRSTGSFSRYTD